MLILKRKAGICLGIWLVFFCCLGVVGQEVEEEIVASPVKPLGKYEPLIRGGGQYIEIAGTVIESLWMKDAGKGKTDFWRYFMHGMTDHRGYPLVWEAFLGNGQAGVLDKTVLLDSAVKSSGLSSVCLPGKGKVVFEKPLLSMADLSAVRGRTLRFYVWLKGEDTGRGAALWDGAPQVSFYVKDANDFVVASKKCNFRTRGTFPWHCYYIEVPIPAVLALSEVSFGDEAKAGETKAEEGGSTVVDDVFSASFLSDLGSLVDSGTDEGVSLPSGGGVYVRLANPVSGKAWFSTMSWEVVTAENTPVREKRCDPTTGSMAPNPDYDELPMHLYYGLSKDHTWKFLKGNKAFGDLTYKSIMKDYVLNVAVKDWSHTLHALPYMVQMVGAGTMLGLVPPIELGWTEALGDLLEGLQDPESGLWKLDGHGSLELTYLIVANSFSARQCDRGDSVVHETPWLGVGNRVVPRAAAMCDSILGAQCRDRRGGKHLAGWTRFAFKPQSVVDGVTGMGSFEMCSSAAAVQLLLRCYPLVDGGRKSRIRESLRGAWSYAMQTVFRPNGLWYQGDALPDFRGPAFGFQFLEGTQWLETKRNVASVPKPEVETELNSREDFTVNWKPQNEASLRIYATKPGIDPSTIGDKDLIVVVHNANAKSLATMDALLALREIALSAEKTWGATPEKYGAIYAADKIALFNKQVKIAQGNRIVIPKPTERANEEGKLVYWLAATSPYSELSEFVKVNSPAEESGEP
jgi:hypothetical protein